MPSVGILILLVLVGTWMCVKARAAGPSAAFAALTVLFIVSTPVGSGLPDLVGSVFSAVDDAFTATLNEYDTKITAVQR